MMLIGWNMDLSLNQKAVLITGGAGTLGMAAARCFAAESAKVGLLDLASKREDPGVVSFLAEFPEQAAFFPLDLVDETSIRECVAAVLARFGVIDAVVHNAATFHFSPVCDWGSTAPLDLHYAVGVQGPVRLQREIWKQCPSALGGSVVVISSVAGHVGEPDAFAYTPIKAAQKGFALSCAMEMSAHGGWAVSVSPGHIWGPIHRSRAEAAGLGREAYEQSKPNIQSTLLGRFLEPAEVARWIVLAASPTGQSLTGQDLRVTLGIEAGGFNRGYDTSAGGGKVEW